MFSLKLLVVMLVAAESCIAAPTGVETAAQVVETPPRVMTVQPLATFNHGKPFLAERDPVTGAFDLRTTPVNSDDYLYEEFEDSGEAIDRKDEGASHTANHIISIPSKDSELHKFLNLPVHYSSASKFPLISSSYANTKIQGHGASNHRPATTITTSTVSPSYYPHRTTGSTSTTTTRRPITSSTTLSTTTRTTTTTTTTSTLQPPPAYEYEYEYDYNEPIKPVSEPPKSDYDFMSFFNFGASSSSTSQRPVERSTTTSTVSPTRESTTTTKKPLTSRPTDPTTRVPSTTSQQSKVENEPKPSVAADGGVDKTSPSSTQDSTMIAIKSESIPIRNKTENADQKQKNDAKTTEVIGLTPPVKTPDSIMKPPPRFGDKIETKVETDGWRGKPELSSDYYSSRPNSNSQQSSAVPSQTSGHAKPYDAKTEGSTNHVKYSAVNRPHEIVTKRPIEFHTHLVAQMNPTHKEQDRDDDEENMSKVEEQDNEEVTPQVVVPISSTPQGLQLSQQHQNTEGPPSGPSEYPPVEPEKHLPVTKPTEHPSQSPTITFPEVESPQLRPQQSSSSDQVYHSTINDEKPPRPPASTYLQRPLIYGAPSQPQTEKGQLTTGQVEPDENIVLNKVSYRPQPGLVSSYQPHPLQHPNYVQLQHSSHVQQQQYGQQQQTHNQQSHGQQQQSHGQQQQSHGQQQQSHAHQQQQQSHGPQHQSHGQQQQSHGQQQQSHGQQQQSHGLQQLSHGQHQQGHGQQLGHSPQPTYSPQQPAYHSHKVQPQPFGSPSSQLGNQPNGQDDQRPVAWPPKGKPQQDNQNVPPFAFFPRPEQRPAGVGSVEAVRPPPRKPEIPGSVAVSSVSPETQSYSLQTSFSIGVPSGVGDDGKVTAGTVSAVPVGTSGPISHQAVSVSHQPAVNHQQVSVGQLPHGQLQLDPRQPQATPHLAQPVSGNTIKYPPPPWEGNLNKPYKESLKRKPLPNILPQFRPNAKVGTAEPPGPHLMGGNVNYLREPMDRLQPPPLPPQPRPLLRSDDHHQQQPHGHPQTHQQLFPPVRPVAAAYHRAENPTSPLPSAMLPPQPVHRRNGVGTKVATLQMIQSPPPITRKAEEPIMIVYPSNNAEAAALKGNWRQQSPDFGNDDEFPHDLNDARKDMPILKGKPTTKPQIKVEFPYPLVKPLPDNEVKEYQAYVPTSPSPDKTTVSAESPMPHHLQDYHPAMAASSSGPPRRVVPQEAEFGWSVIGARAEDDMTTTPVSGSSTSGPMVIPQLTGGFRPIPAPNLD